MDFQHNFRHNNSHFDGIAMKGYHGKYYNLVQGQLDEYKYFKKIQKGLWIERVDTEDKEFLSLSLILDEMFHTWVETVKV